MKGRKEGRRKKGGRENVTAAEFTVPSTSGQL